MFGISVPFPQLMIGIFGFSPWPVLPLPPVGVRDFGDSSNSENAGDPITRRSISGFILYVFGVPVSWQSKVQRSVMLSSSNDELVGFSETAKKVCWLFNYWQA